MNALTSIAASLGVLAVAAAAHAQVTAGDSPPRGLVSAQTAIGGGAANAQSPLSDGQCARLLQKVVANPGLQPFFAPKLHQCRGRGGVPASGVVTNETVRKWPGGTDDLTTGKVVRYIGPPAAATSPPSNVSVSNNPPQGH
jgi:hypothetical protein